MGLVILIYSFETGTQYLNIQKSAALAGHSLMYCKFEFSFTASAVQLEFSGRYSSKEIEKNGTHFLFLDALSHSEHQRTFQQHHAPYFGAVTE